MTTTDISLECGNEGTVYGLVASDEPLQIRYVGKTILVPQLRLQEHLSCRATLKIKQWTTEVKERGAQVRLRVLGQYPIMELAKAERWWIWFWSSYCELHNVTFSKYKIWDNVMIRD